MAKEGARHHGYTGKRGYHPLLAVAAVTGDVLMARLREGRANTARGAAHFLRETVGRVRYAGARGQLTMRADSGFYTHTVVAVCRRTKVRFSITIRQHQSLRNLIEAVPEADWTPIPYWMEGAADVAETTYTPFQSEPGAAPVRLIVRAGEADARLPTGPLRHLQLSPHRDTIQQVIGLSEDISATKPIPRWDAHFGGLEDDRTDSTEPHITFRSQLGCHRQRGLAICTFHLGFSLGTTLPTGE